MKVKKIILMSLLVAIAITLSIFERFIPVPQISPGAKLGLANIITVSSIVLFSKKDAFAILMLRILLGSMIGGGMVSLMYSLTGGILSYIIMVIMVELNFKNVSLIGISVLGGLFHNIGQLIVASFVLKSTLVYSYLPVLSLSGIGTGIIVGLISMTFVKIFSKTYPTLKYRMN